MGKKIRLSSPFQPQGLGKGPAPALAPAARAGSGAKPSPPTLQSFFVKQSRQMARTGRRKCMGCGFRSNPTNAIACGRCGGLLENICRMATAGASSPAPPPTDTRRSAATTQRKSSGQPRRVETTTVPREHTPLDSDLKAAMSSSTVSFEAEAERQVQRDMACLGAGLTAEQRVEQNVQRTLIEMQQDIQVLSAQQRSHGLHQIAKILEEKTGQALGPNMLNYVKELSRDVKAMSRDQQQQQQQGNQGALNPSPLQMQEAEMLVAIYEQYARLRDEDQEILNSHATLVAQGLANATKVPAAQAVAPRQSGVKSANDTSGTAPSETTQSSVTVPTGPSYTTGTAAVTCTATTAALAGQQATATHRPESTERRHRTPAMNAAAVAAMARMQKTAANTPAAAMRQHAQRRRRRLAAAAAATTTQNGKIAKSGRGGGGWRRR